MNQKQEMEADKIKASILGGAIGDALGAALEGVRDFSLLNERFGSCGVREFIEMISPFPDQRTHKPGDTTDDTASIVGTIAALDLSTSNEETRLHHLWQANVIWASQQSDGEGIAQFIDREIEWPEWYTPFFANSGAGRGTLSALLEGRMGTPENPLVSTHIVRGKKPNGPNKGCGGMMRVAPLAFLKLTDEQTIDLAVRATAITHGAPEAQAAAAAVALTIKKVFNGAAINHAAYLAMLDLQNMNVAGHEKCRNAYDAARAAYSTKPLNCATVSELPCNMSIKDEFLAIPVLSQVFYGAMIAEDMLEDRGGSLDQGFLETIGMCATITGDSDSVASILGNIIGASWGTKALPQELLDQMHNRHALDQAASSLERLAIKFELHS